MPNRPTLNDESFLRFLFSPKKNQKPTGLRARSLVPGKGRAKGRVASYNRMSAVNQEMLKRSGQRDAYLKGEISLAEARKSVRQTAVDRGFARPLPGMQPRRTATARRRNLDAFVASRIVHGLRGEGRNPRVATVVRNVQWLPDDVYDRVDQMSGRDMIAYATDNDNEILIGGKKFNPLWYH